MTGAAGKYPSSIRLQAADVLRRARKLPVGPNRNDLRQLAMGLLWLEKHGFEAKLAEQGNATRTPQPSSDSKGLT
jgi:hypothetical protein